MKTKLFLMVIAVAAVMITLSSCEKDPYELIVVESEVLDSGAEDVKLDLSQTGMSLSYTSWIRVDQKMGTKTRSSDGTLIEVPIENKIDFLSGEYEVPSFKLGEPQTNVSYRLISNMEHDKYVIVTDSAMVVTLAYDFLKVELPLPYTVPVYQDGITRLVMPHYKYAKEFSLSAASLDVLDNRVIGEGLYACQLYKQNISVNFNNKNYDVKAEFLLKKKIGAATSVYFLRSEYVNGSDKLASQGNLLKSSMEIKKYLSNGSSEIVAPSTTLYYEVGSPESNWLRSEGDPKNILLSQVLVEPKRVELKAKDGNVTTRDVEENLIVRYNAFDIVIPLLRSDALYNDGYLEKDLPSYKYLPENLTVKNINLTFVEDEGDRVHYTVAFEATMKVGDYSLPIVYNNYVTFFK